MNTTPTLDDIQAALDAVQGAFADAPADTGSIYTPPPDDDYEALIHEFEFLGGDWGVGLKVRYQITNHSMYAGRVVGDLFSLTPERIQWLKGFLGRLDVNTEEIDVTVDLRPGSEMLNGLLDTPVLIKVKRSMGTEKGTGQPKEYVNVYLQRKLGAPGSNGQGFTPIAASDVTTPADAFDFGNVGGANQYTPTDDDIPF